MEDLLKFFNNVETTESKKVEQNKPGDLKTEYWLTIKFIGDTDTFVKTVSRGYSTFKNAYEDLISNVENKDSYKLNIFGIKKVFMAKEKENILSTDKNITWILYHQVILSQSHILEQLKEIL